MSPIENANLDILKAGLGDPRATASDLLLLTFLALRGPGEYPTNELTETLRISRTALFGAFTHLSTLGYLIIDRKDESGRRAASHYKIVMPPAQVDFSSRTTEEQVWDLSAVCKLIARYDMSGFSLTTSKRRVQGVALELMDVPTFSPELLIKLYRRPDGEWYKRDWRGKQGQSPTPEQMLSSWAFLYEGYTAATPAVFNDDGSVYQ